MPISLDAIYQPLNEFFLQKFGQNDGTEPCFRFAQIPFGFYDSDFVVPSMAEVGPSSALATEQFSNLVDRIPRLDPGGRSVYLEAQKISDLYHDELLVPSFPLIPADADAVAKQALIDNFSQIKNDAILRWENSKATSVVTSGSFVHLASATPQDWWNKSDAAIWTSQSFEIQGAATIVTDQPSDQLLRMKLGDRALQPILESQPNRIGSAVAFHSTVVASPSVLAPREPILAARPMLAAFTRTAPVASREIAFRPVETSASLSTAAVPSNAMHNDLIAHSAALSISDRIALNTAVAQNAPTQSVTVTDVTINFDFCLVTADRPWIHSAFLNSKSWFIPGQPKGALSANDGHGLPALPIGFVALRNLSIRAPWTSTDITNLENSIQFGPFLIDSTVVSGAIGHTDMQVVGWIFESLPDQPPADDPTLPPPVTAPV